MNLVPVAMDMALEDLKDHVRDKLSWKKWMFKLADVLIIRK